MTYLKFYQKDKEVFFKEKQIILGEKDVKKLANKMARHFKFKILFVKVKNLKSSLGLAYPYGIILARRNINLYTFCHELAHCYQWQYNKNRRHNKKLRRTITKFLRYCNKMEYWRKEQ